jgi:GT2 family glycosyltransferase
MMFYIATATRRPPNEFENDTALGKSYNRLSYDKRLAVKVAPSNTRGLPVVYNEILDGVPDDSIVAFMHDDIWIDDYFMIQHVVEALDLFDVIGLVGNRRRLPKQPAWHSTKIPFEWDEPQYLSGVVAHGANPSGAVTCFGRVPARCELLDGLFLAAKKAVLTKNDVRFDPRFDFHFYDMDFCRTARLRGLRLGTWPICLTHQGTGVFGTPEWTRNYEAYLSKWGD